LSSPGPTLSPVTHPVSRIERVLDLRARGFSARTFSDHLGIPRRTVNDWIFGRLPYDFMRRDRGCRACGGTSHRFEELPPSYVYLLGVYLGDGSIESHARGVYKLRLTLDASYPLIIEETASAMRQVLPASKVNTWVRPYGDVELYSYSKALALPVPSTRCGPEAPSPDHPFRVAGAVGPWSTTAPCARAHPLRWMPLPEYWAQVEPPPVCLLQPLAGYPADLL
jgi:hypothetical protein